MVHAVLLENTWNAFQIPLNGSLIILIFQIRIIANKFACILPYEHELKLSQFGFCVYTDIWQTFYQWFTICLINTFIQSFPNAELASALHILALANNLPCLTVLMKGKPKLDILDKGGFTPLQRAILHKRQGSAKLLVSRIVYCDVPAAWQFNQVSFLK